MSLINDSWEKLFRKYHIEDEITNHGLFRISAKQIREFKEARLMTKFDSKESLPEIFHGKYAILPVTRGEYVIGPFQLYQDFPAVTNKIERVSIKIPGFLETIDTETITSEAAAINVMAISGILEDFLGEDHMLHTVSGRMGSGKFSFLINGKAPFSPYTLDVNNSQIEIDGGFESPNSFALLEAKNVVNNDFLIRQLYYPLRRWQQKIQKNIRPVFMVYTNKVYRLLEYTFENPGHYNSIRLVKEKRYSFEDVGITLQDILDVYHKAKSKPEAAENRQIPFIQADSFDKVISLLENIAQNPLTCDEIADLFSFRKRQSDYYFNACNYLGLAEKKKDSERTIRVHITRKGREIMMLPYKKRQLSFIYEILRHRIFQDIFRLALQNGKIPDNTYIKKQLLSLHLASEAVAGRRSSSVSGWVNWIFDQCNEQESLF